MNEKPTCCTEEHLRFLDQLRESGATNMFGAAPYLVEMYGLSKADARAVLTHWMETFGERHAEVRAGTFSVRPSRRAS
jgi:hypothetical protein